LGHNILVIYGSSMKSNTSSSIIVIPTSSFHLITLCIIAVTTYINPKSTLHKPLILSDLEFEFGEMHCQSNLIIFLWCLFVKDLVSLKHPRSHLSAQPCLHHYNNSCLRTTLQPSTITTTSIFFPK